MTVCYVCNYYIIEEDWDNWVPSASNEETTHCEDPDFNVSHVINHVISYYN